MGQSGILRADQLGLLAMRFRGTRDESVRNAVATEYTELVQKLIAGGKWKVVFIQEHIPTLPIIVMFAIAGLMIFIGIVPIVMMARVA